MNPEPGENLLLPARSPEIVARDFETKPTVTAPLDEYLNNVLWGTIGPTTGLLYSIPNYSDTLKILPDPTFFIPANCGRSCGGAHSIQEKGDDPGARNCSVSLFLAVIEERF